MRSMLPAELQDSVRVESAGLMAADGMPPTPLTVRVLERRGVEIKEHRARKLTPEIAARADLILALEEEHHRAIASLGQGVAEKTFVLSEFGWEEGRGGERLGIHDPMGGSLEIYEETCRRIEQHLSRALREILDRMGAK